MQNSVTIPDEVIENMRVKYGHVHPLSFLRSLEHAKDAGELFDILESLPNDLPVMWDDVKHRWIVTDDLTQSREFRDTETNNNESGDASA